LRKLTLKHVCIAAVGATVLIVAYLVATDQPSAGPDAAVGTLDRDTETQQLPSTVQVNPNPDFQPESNTDGNARNARSYGESVVAAPRDGLSHSIDDQGPEITEPKQAKLSAEYAWTERNEKFRYADELIRTETEDIEWASQAEKNIESIVSKTFGATDSTRTVLECLETVCYMDMNISRADYSQMMIEFRKEWAASGRHFFSDLRINRMGDELFRFYFFR